MPYSLFAPIFCKIANLSITTGIFPQSEKCVIISQVIKRRSADKENLLNYRPVSQLTFLAKFIERIVSVRVDQFLLCHNLFPPFHSAYRKHHSTETVLVHLLNDISICRSSRLISCMVLLDFSAAFDTVDHSVLLDRLYCTFGFSGTVLKWFSSYLTDRSHCVRVGANISKSCSLLCGVPQGSVLGPRLFSLYVAPISSIIAAYKMNHHIYADDTSIYFSFPEGNADFSVFTMQQCIIHLCDWFNYNMLKVNPEKTSVILFKPPKCNFSSLGIGLRVFDHSLSSSSSVCYLGVTLDDTLSFDQHGISICKSAFAFLRSIYHVRRFLKQETLLCNQCFYFF